MKGKILQTLSILFFLTFQRGIAQNNSILFSKFDSLNGTPIGKINAICQDPNGIMWFCGNTEHCLYRYDGNILTRFFQDDKNPNSLGFYELETIYADDQGLIWIGGDGLDQYNPSTGIFKHYRHSKLDSSTLSDGVNTILKDHLGKVWIGTYSGLDQLDEKTGKFIHYRHDPDNPKSLSDNVVRTLYEDRNGALWVGTGMPFFAKYNEDGGLNRMNPDGSFTRYLHDPENASSLVNNKIRAIFEDSRDNFWVGTSEGGLHIMNREKGTFERYLFNQKHPKDLSAPPSSTVNQADGISFICEDKTGAIWIGSYLEGISKYDPFTKQMTRYDMGNGFPDSTTYKGFISQDGTLWVATEESGLLYRADPNSRIITNIYSGNQVFKFLEDDGKIWVATLGGLLKYDENETLIHRFKHNPKDPSSIPNDTVISLLKISKDDTVWIGTDHGIVILNTISEKFSKFSFGPGTHDFTTWNIIQDKKANLWFGTLTEGLFRYNRNDRSVTQWLPDPKDSCSIGSHKITFVFEDKGQNLWVGTKGEREGIWKLNSETGKFRCYLPGMVGRYLFEDQEGDLWAGTNNGLFRYNKKGDNFFAFFDAQSVLHNEHTAGMVEDREKNLWITTPSAIVKINPERNGSFLYGERFGVSLLSPFINEVCKTSKDQILVGNRKGFYAFYPEELAVDMEPLKLMITDFFFNMASGLIGKDSSNLKFAENKSEISLAHDENNFGFKFNVSDYRLPELVRYYTMLENYDPVWRQSGVDKTVYYFNLSPGDYVFRVKAFNNNEMKGERQIRIHISPPWWTTWWAFSLSGIFVIGGFYLVYRNRIRSLKKRQAEQIKAGIQAQEEERRRISRDLHDDIGTKLSALKLFISALEVKAQASQNEEIISLAESSEQFIKEVVGDLRHLLTNLSPSVLEEFGYTSAVEGLINKINQTKRIHFRLNVFGFKKRLQKDYELNLYRITQELINNILKHADARNIAFQVGLRDEKIILIIEDDGKGFDINEHKDGLGLKNLETRTKILNGKMIIESTPGIGTTMLIEIPYNFV